MEEKKKYININNKIYFYIFIFYFLFYSTYWPGCHNKQKMHIKSIELTGFKSYRNKTTLVFAPSATTASSSGGINVILGENGQGKSNVYDGMFMISD